MTKAFKMRVAKLQFEKVVQIMTLNLKTKSNNCSFSLIFFQLVIKA